jgi:hypothetical protein
MGPPLLSTTESAGCHRYLLLVEKHLAQAKAKKQTQ